MTQNTDITIGIAIGKMLQMRVDILGLKRLIKSTCRDAKARLASAQREYNRMGFYDDCGDFYKDNLVEAEARLTFHNALIPKLISMQKQLKRMKATFRDNYPQGIKYLDQALIQQDRELDAMMRGAGLRRKNAEKDKQRDITRLQALMNRQNTEL